MKVLVVEDNEPLRRSISQRLRESGFAVDETGDGPEGLWLATENKYAVAILDLMLPGLDGIELLRKMRKQNEDSSVLIITARDQVGDRVAGLDAGADDYLVKPFALDELMARVRALTRRAHSVKNPILKVGDLEIDTRRRAASRGGEAIDLTAREYALLELLALRAGEVVSRAEIWEQLYDFNQDPESNVVDVFVAYLRRKIEREGKPKLIHTRRGMGYILEERAEA
ncbi:MAG: two-component system, OmpR family, copper resistance phosphate regulon response regulator CusR [Verrucomicrobia bacterium]|jgi:DNA-binding response OmpR family regulator|nr:MAG: two-component system, OmpR family, copper resistance phosphate regulon response regulator CusR [Verrucomicrobiota bacterium]